MSKNGSRGGKRADLGDQYFRSAWEANYARYLNWLVQVGQIAKWAYEPDTFEFPVKRGNRFYTPDFKVTNLDGTFEYHEVKGYLDQASKTKIYRFMRYFPRWKLVVIDGDAYRAIARQMKNAIPGWE